MNKKKQVILFAAVIFLGAGGFFLFYPKTASSSALVVYGNVDIREVDLAFRVFGKVKTLYVDEGDVVKEGDLLAELDPLPYEEQLQEAKAEVAYAEISYLNATKQWERRKAAVMSASISEEEYENGLANMKEKNAAFERAKASLSVAKTSLEDTFLKAPSGGSILSRIREPGSVINAGQSVYSLSLFAPIWVRAYVSEVDLGRIYPGMSATVQTDTPGAPLYKGTIGYISPVAEFTPKNVETVDLRTELVYRIRVIIQDQVQGLRQGMPVTVILEEESKNG